jgi:hypothetical protein
MHNLLPPPFLTRDGVDSWYADLDLKFVGMVKVTKIERSNSWDGKTDYVTVMKFVQAETQLESKQMIKIDLSQFPRLPLEF